MKTKRYNFAFVADTEHQALNILAADLSSESNPTTGVWRFQKDLVKRTRPTPISESKERSVLCCFLLFECLL